LTGVDAAARKAAVAALDGASPAVLPAIAKRLADLKKSADRDAMAAVLTRLHKGTGGNPAVDLFERTMAAPSPGETGWREVASVLGLSRMLVRIGTTPAARELAAIYPGFGDLFRLEVERDMKALGERAVAALIELRRGEAKPLRPWAAKLLDALGKAVPGEAVQTADNQVLADVLRAYGRTKDVDAARVIVSFANSDRTQVREAAREAVGMLGDNGIWQLRESYENLVGKKPPEDWGWEKLSTELFAAYDRSRLAEVYAMMDEGTQAYKAGKLDAMASAYDRVLARAPAFEKRRDMVPGYLEFARSIKDSDRPRAIAELRRAIRIDPSGPRAREAESELTYLEALELAGHGLVDESAYRRAVELDPNNREAREALGRIQGAASAGSSGIVRYVLASTFALLAMGCAALAFLWRRRTAG
jgi:tetratricopeptide (TPR) repeat protein